ncbi:hypothetical protein PMAC_000991 [Pneumocystis sp. 'macacae']|nr:hypothetical protein PMAC_000991 [Pneumocystis sp. 'macacae']
MSHMACKKDLKNTGKNYKTFLKKNEMSQNTSATFDAENTTTTCLYFKPYKQVKKELRTENKHRSRTSQSVQRQNIELTYEKIPRQFDSKKNILDTFTLPIKTKDGHICFKEVQNIENKQLEKPSNKVLNECQKKTIQIETEMSRDIRETLASVAQKIIEHPEENIKQLKTLREMTLNQTASIQRLGLLTQLAVYKDIIPGYSIRPLTNIEKTSRMSKETKERRLFEESLVLNYYTYICLLSKTIEIGQKSPKNSPQQFLSEISFSCVCHLLLSIPHFNYRDTLLEIISTKLTQKTLDASFIECKKTVEELFENDKEGRISFEIVKKLTDLMKRKNYKVSDTVLNTFLKLKFLSQSNLTASQKNVDNPRKRKHEKQFKSKKMRKLEKKNKKIESEIDSIEKVNEEKEMFQGKILKLIFTTYFQILQNGFMNLVYASLEGIKKFSYLINVDFFEDLLKILKELLKNKFNVESNMSLKNTTKGGLLCIITAFKLLSEQAQIKKIVNLDLSTFIIYLYSTMIPMSLNPYIEANMIYRSKRYKILDQDHAFNDLTEIDIFAECFNHIFFQDKNSNLLKASAFIKRLLTVLLGFPEKSILKSLELIQRLIKKHPKLSFFLNSNENYGEGIYNGEIDNPDLSNPYLTFYWELILLKVNLFFFTKLTYVETLFPKNI